MKAICFVVCLIFLSVNAVVNQPTQEAQRREAPAGPQQEYGPPQQAYGPPKANVQQQMAIRQQKVHAMQRLIAAMRNAGYSNQQQARVVNRPRPIPLNQNYGPPKQNYGPPHSTGSGSSGSLASFMNNHNPDVRCDGWIPIPGPTGGSGHAESHQESHHHQHSSSGGSAGSVASIDNSYGPPRHGSGNSGGLNTQIIVPDDSYGPPPPSQPANSYGPPDHGHGGQSGHHEQSNHGAFEGHSISQGFAASGNVNKPDDSYGPPPPAPIYHHQEAHHEESHSGHSEHSSHSAVSLVSSVDSSYGPPQQQQQGHAVYGPPEVQPQQHVQPHPQPHIQPREPVNSYGPPASGHSETHEEVHHHHSAQGHGGDIQTIQSLSEGLTLPDHDGGAHFNSAIGLVTSSLGVSAGHNEVVQSHAIHESHTSELTNNFNGGDSYAAPPLDSYEPGKYAPSFLKPQQPHQPQPHQPQPQHQHQQPQHQPRPQPQPQPRPHPPPQPRPHPPPPPANNYLPQRPPPQFAPRPQYIPPVPMKLNRPQAPPPQFRPQGNSHAQSVAHGYSQQSQSHHQHQQNQQQSIHAAGPIRQQPRYPLPHRPPVPQGLFQSIGQHVQALDSGHRGQANGNTYLPPSPAELPIPPMKLMLPNPTPPQQFLTQHQHHQSSAHGSSASSGAAYSYQSQGHGPQIQIIHDCGKGPQLSGQQPHQNYGPPQQNYEPPQQNYGPPQQQPQQNYGPPSGPPAESYGTPLGQPLTSYQVASPLTDLSSNYEIPQVALEVPQHNSIDFNSPSNSYGPPASGPASLDVLGLESRQRANTIVLSEQQNLVGAASDIQITNDGLPGLSSGLGGLDFISASKSHSIEVPHAGGQTGSYQLQFQTSHSDQEGNRVDAPNHQQILADGLLQSILTAIEKQPSQTVPQVTDDLETDHSEVQVFLKSPAGQEVLADKAATSSGESHSS